MLLNNLINQLTSINNNYGKGDITEVTISLAESRPHHGEFYGTVSRQMQYGTDVRMFKVVNRTLTFLSHKRKLEV